MTSSLSVTRSPSVTRTSARRLLLGLALLLGAAAPITAAQAADSVLGWIVVEPQPDNLLTLSGRVYAADAFDGRYTLAIRRQGAGGTAETTQGGAVHVDAGAETGLSTTTVTFAPGDRLRIELSVFQGDEKLSSAQVVVGE